MGLLKRIIEYSRQRNTLKYELYKFLQKYSRVSDDSPVIIVWELGGFGDIMKKNSIISAALNIRGYRTHFIVCDGTPVACIQRGLERNEKIEDWKLRCPGCLRVMKYVAVQYNAEYSLAGDYINEDKKREFRE